MRRRIELPTDEDIAPTGLTRRAVMAGGLAGALALFAADSLGLDSPQASADATGGPTTPAAMAQLALNSVEQTLSQLQSTTMTQKPFSVYAGDWCAVFAAWLCRVPINPLPTSYTYANSLYSSQTAVTTPIQGDLIHYVNSEAPGGHIGVVVAINADGSPSTVEGNTPPPKSNSTGWMSTMVKHYQTPWSTAGITFARPNWSGISATETALSYIGEDEAAMIYRNSATGQIALIGPGMHIFASLDEYNKWAAIIGIWNAQYPQFAKPTPPNANNASAFIGLDSYGWSVMTSVYTS